MKYLACFLLIFLLLACNALRVNYDFDERTDFSNYTTYNYFPEMETGLSGLDTKRLLVIVDSTMMAKGILYSEEPDFFINIESITYPAGQGSNVGVGLGGGGRNIGGGVSIGIPVGQANIQRDIKFDFIDSQNETLFWQAVSSGAFNEEVTPQVREKNLRTIANKVFEKYPPEAKR